VQAYRAIKSSITPEQEKLLQLLSSVNEGMTNRQLAREIVPNSGQMDETAVANKVGRIIKPLGELLLDAMQIKRPPTVEPEVPGNTEYSWAAFTSWDKRLRKWHLLPQFKEALLLVSSPSSQELAELEHERKTRLQEILWRPGQAKFREGLIAAYGRCAVTGCEIVEALEAAHVKPYSESLSDCPTNGLLLRADIHTLFDLYLIGIEPITHTVKLTPALKKSCYGELEGRKLFLPADKSKHPDPKWLVARWQKFSES
jgi:hypothetical protein